MDMGTRGKLQCDEGEANTAFKRQGSLRKVLPPITTVNEVGVTSIVTSTAVKMIDRPPSSVSDNKVDGVFGGNGRSAPSGIEHLVSQEYVMISEYQLLLKQAIPGMYIIPSANSAFLWFGVYFIHEGMYEGGVFRFQLRIPSTFPSSGSPELIFETPIFHPMVDPQTGVFAYKDALEVVEADEKKTEFSDRASFGTNDHNSHSRHIWPILLAFQSAMLRPQTSTPLNGDAAEMHRSNSELFAQKAAESAKCSLEHLNDPTAINDPHYFVFKEYDEQIHEQYRKKLLNQMPLENTNSSSTIGLSWVQPGTLIPFSKKLSFL
ncbi:AKT-interacting protein homolog B-like [Ischnura elegans]|uniref:AKT-interacting protein homolog B-like n=1 Tax=Ischnura elegans TaxID=197161 RepID=UPI001ED8756A|nr:AKT-interacting protein homolog B-like [Ischnura elegans]